ncbi:hypothetical protein ACFLZX_01665 [Nanoarchaeota archaeon]
MKKRGAASEELLFTIFQYVVAFVVLLILFKFYQSASDETLYKKVYLSRDMAITMNTLHIFDDGLSYRYTSDAADVSVFDYYFDENRAGIVEHDFPNSVRISYPYASNRGVDIPRTVAYGPGKLIFEKSKNELKITSE